MSYLAPAGNAADVSWQGAAAYTPPAGNAADIIWATGLHETRFGTPSAAQVQPVVGVLLTSFGLAHVHPIQVGFSSTAIGTPYAIFAQIGSAAGVYSTQFGSHHNILTARGVGSVLTNYGAPYGVQHWDMPPIGIVTRYGAVFYAYHVTEQATGLTKTVVGIPTASRTNPGGIGINADTYGVYSMGFGTHNAAYPQTRGVTGFTLTQHGTHEARRAGTVPGINSTLFGAHSNTARGYAPGIYPTRYGTPTATRRVYVSSAPVHTRFGAPYIWRSNTYPVYGVNASGRVGQPTGFSRHNHPVTGFFTSYVGVPSCRERSRVTHIPPGSAFGTPLLKRVLTC